MCCHALLPDPAVLAFQYCSVRDGTFLVFASVRPTRPGGARCPDCGWQATRVHSTYERRLRDLPWFGNAVEIVLTSRKLFCDNPACQRRIFTERIPTVAERYARRTLRLASLFYLLVYAVGGEVGRRIAQAAGLLVSADTLLRRIRRVVFSVDAKSAGTRQKPQESEKESEYDPGGKDRADRRGQQVPDLGSSEAPAKAPAVIGIDDFAFRKGHRYGTIIIDQEAGKPIDLLPSRDADAVAQWLKEHAGIKIVTRDRSPVYAQAIREGAPKAVQVADRFHLLKNLVEAVERQMIRLHGAVRKAAASVASDAAATATATATATAALTPTPTPTPTVSERHFSPAPTADSERRRQRRAERFAEVKRLLAEGYSQREVARMTGRSRPTIRKYASYDTAPEVATRKRSRPSKVAAFAEYLRKRWYDNHCCCAIQLYREIAAQGFTGGRAQVQRFVQPWRKRPRCRTAGSGGGQAGPPFPQPSPRSCAFLLLYPDHPQVTAQQREFTERLVAGVPEAALAQHLAQRFIDLVKDRNAVGLDPWLVDAESAGISELRAFARGLRQDRAAVDAALTLEWSNGPTEGQVNRLKLIKRSMYGTSSFELLRARVLQPAPIGLSG